MTSNDIIKQVGNTPITKLSDNLFIKEEKYNPSGSIKDRAVAFMIHDAFESGKLTCGGTIIEPTSGNTGIAISYFAKLLGLNCKIVMPSSMSVERREMIKQYGGEVVLSDASLGMKGAIDLATELQSTLPNAVILSQFDNPSNVKAHFLTTAREIDSYFKGKIDIVIAGIGTGGTITGIAKYLKDQNKHIQIIGIEPETSKVIATGKAGKHKIQGIGANFVPSILDLTYIDFVTSISDDEAFDGVRELKTKYQIDVGISSGASYAVAKKMSVIYPDKKICFIAPDGGDRYLSLNIHGVE